MTNLAATIDSHVHLWNYNSVEYGWLQGSLQPLQCDFLVPQLVLAMQSAKVDGVVAVQARQCIEETLWLLELAAKNDEIKGVVGWASLTQADFPLVLEKLLRYPKLKGLRHVLQGEPNPDFMLSADFNRGLAILRETSLVYDLLIREDQMAQAIRLVDRHPGQIFILDHIAKPSIAARKMEPWATRLRELARRPNVFCKLSGLVTEAGAGWTGEQLRPYIATATEAFGTGRLLAGSDWPVCLADAAYDSWFSLLRDAFRQHSSDEQAAVFGGNAASVYRLAAS